MVCCVLWLWPLISASGGDAQAPPDETYPFAPAHWPPVRVASVGPDGTIRLVPAVAGATPLPTEGCYLIAPLRLLTGRATSSASRPLDGLVRVEVTDVGEDHALTAKSGAEAATILRAGDVVLLVRPGGMATAKLRALPAVIPLLKEGDPRTPRGLRTAFDAARQAARLDQSVANLQKMGKALHGFHEATNHLPPAVVFGPDGKPWHSWRVLLLPYLGETQLFNRYDFTQPWDSPRNRALIARRPSVYRDPEGGDASGSSTHYAALVGERTAFPPRGSRITITDGRASSDLYNGTMLPAVTDGTSNTMAIVPVDPARRIPWTKPEDIAVGRDRSGLEVLNLGRPGGIFTPARIGGVGVAPVLFLDGAVHLLSDRIDADMLRALATMNGSDIVIPSKILGPPAADGSGDGSLRRLYLIRDGQAVSAMIEPAAALGPESPGPPPAADRKGVGRPSTPTKGGR
jgi:hypothetical protein